VAKDQKSFTEHRKLSSGVDWYSTVYLDEDGDKTTAKVGIHGRVIVSASDRHEFEVELDELLDKYTF